MKRQMKWMRGIKREFLGRRLVSVLFAICMVFTMLPQAAFAAETGAPICENHQTHNAECGYIEAKEAKPCSHLQEDGSYSCAPVKDSGRVGAPGSVTTPESDTTTLPAAGEAYVCNHSDGCGYAEAVEGVPCKHTCEKCANALPPLPAVMPLLVNVNETDYEFDGNGYLTIKTDDGATKWREDKRIVGDDVTKPNYTAVKKVTIASGVTTIGDDAFNSCTAFDSVIIPESVTTIGYSAFYGCTALQNVTFTEGSKLTAIGEKAFFNCSMLKEAAIPESVTTISSQAFFTCVLLESVTIPERVTEIGQGAFSGCKALQSVTFLSRNPPNTFGTDVFKGTHNDLKIYVPATDVVTAYKAKLPAYEDKIVAGKITSNEGYSFHSGTGTLTVTTDAGTTAWKEDLSIIGTGESADYSAVKSVNTGSGVTVIGRSAFQNCTALTSVTFAKSIWLEKIGNNAFQNCAALTRVTFAKNSQLETIGDNAFQNCAALTSVVIPVNVKTIGNDAFSACALLKNVTIPVNVTKIGANAFSACALLESVTIPKSVTEIGANAFSACTALKEVTFEGEYTPGTVGTDVFKDTPSGLKIYVPLGSDEAYKGIPALSPYKDEIEPAIIGEGYRFDSGTGALTVTTDAGILNWKKDDDIGGYGTLAYAAVKSVSIGNDVQVIGVSAFASCPALERVTIPANVTAIGTRAFFNCLALQSVTFAEGSQLTEIGDEAFRMTRLKSMNIPNGVTTIGKEAFNECTWLKSVTIPASVTKMKESVFTSCPVLKSVTFEGSTPPTTYTDPFENTPDYLAIYVPASRVDAYRNAKIFSAYAKQIAAGEAISGEGYSFHSGTGALTVTTDAGTTAWREDNRIVPSLSKNASYSAVKSVKIENGVEEIGQDAFSGCTELKSVFISTSVTSIGDSAFSSCEALESMAFAEGSQLATIGNAAFSGCSSFTGVSIPEDVTEIGMEAFSGCKELKEVAFEGTTPPEFGTDVLKDIHADLKIYVPEGRVDAYQGAPALTAFKEKIVAGEIFFSESYRFNSSTGALTVIDDAGTTEWREDKRFADPTEFASYAVVQSVSIGSDIKAIGLNAFNGCSSLKDATIPASVTKIDKRAFQLCKGLKSVTFKGATPPTFDTDVFKLTNDNLKIYVPEGSADAYKAVSNLADFKNNIAEDPKPAAVTSVAVAPKTASVQLGTTQQFSAAVTGTNNPAQSVTWAVTGGAKVGTAISATGLLTVAADETATNLTVTATSTVDTAKSDTAAVTVTTTPVVKYTLTVTNGTGSGSFEAGASVTVTANAPAAGKVFDKWATADGVAFADATAAATTITMPAKAVTVTATYKDTPATMVPVTGVTLNKSAISLYSNASPRSETLTAVVTPANAANKAVIWSSSNPAAATVENGVVTAVANGTATITVTTADGGKTASCTVTVSTRSGSSSSDGDSSDDDRSDVAATPPTPEKPNNPAGAEIKVESKTDTNGNVSVSVPEKSVTDAIKAAQDAAKQAGTTDNGIAVTLRVETSTAANSISAALPQTAVAELVKAGAEELKIESKTADITLDLATMKQIQAAGGDGVTVSANKVNSSGLSQAAQAAIGSRPVFELSIKSGSKAITNFGTGSVSVAFPYTLGANEKAGIVCGVYVDDAGKVTYLTNSSYDTNSKTLMFSTNHFSTFGIGYQASAPVFTDTTSHWAKADIDFVVSRGMLSGTSATTFSPNTGMTRGAFVTALGKLANVDVSSYKTSSFSDVKADSPYMGYIEWASRNGILSGSGSNFMPEQSITREELAVILQNYAKATGFTLPKVHEEKRFTDSAKISSSAENAVKAMQMAGVLRAKNGNVFDPQGVVTRAEASTVLRRFVELRIGIDMAQGWTMNDSGKWMYYENGKPVTGQRDIDGVSYTFDLNGETSSTPKNLAYTTQAT